jgi:hypothetical protein
MSRKNAKFPWEGKINNHAQVGGIETSVLDNGLGKGVRIAWVNTGSGLRYKVVIDRALDIVDAFYNQYSLTWLSHCGITAPRPDANRGVEWIYSFGGGLLTTCGLTHIGPPESDEYGERGLHGRVSNIPASLESVVQPDPVSGKLEMSITATVKESRLFGPNLELKRTISSTIGESVIRIHDVVTNRGNVPSPHMILYHWNFGWPMIDEGVDIVWRGKWQSRGLEMDNELFNNKHDFRKCQKPLELHKGGHEAAGFIDPACDSKGFCTVGYHNRKLNMAVSLKFNKKQLPCLTNWQHWGPGEYVSALEPGNALPIGQGKFREEKKLTFIDAGKSKTYDLEISVLTDQSRIEKFITNCGQ